MKKKYTTRDGRAVRIYAVYHNQRVAVHGAILSHDEWQIYNWYGDGMCFSSGEKSDGDLIEVNERTKQ